jgi:hypothetical protein
VKAVADALGVSRSTLAREGSSTTRGPYEKPLDAALLARIKPIVDARGSTATGVSRRS